MGHAKTNTSPELDDNELQVLKLFIGGMTRIGAYREVFPIDISDKTIYTWYKTEKVKNYLAEYEYNLADYNVVTDKILLEIIKSKHSKDSDKIKAIKLWNDIKGRITNLIKVENESTINLEGISDEELEKLIKAIQDGDK